MARLLIVHHTTSPPMQAMLEAVMAGAGTDGIEGVEVVTRAALTASAVDVLGADGYLLGTGLRWHRPRPPVVGEVGPKDLEACWELGATVAAELVS